MTGTLYGVGVGPGDPELMTIKAVKRLRSCQVIAIPHKIKEQCVAYQIAKQTVPEIDHKDCLCLHMPMTKDPLILDQCHKEAADRIIEYLKRGIDVALITLGDATVYATSTYLQERVSAFGYPTIIENGIPSFCAAAATLNIPLVSGSEELHIIPASYSIEKALELPGVKVLMKAGKQMEKVKKLLSLKNCKVTMVENCGMAEEKIYYRLEDIPVDAGYYSLLIVRE